jgi:hypothetical protein
VNAVGLPQEYRAHFLRAHNAITASIACGEMLSTLLEACERISIPISARARMAGGFTREGCEPADDR